MNPNLDVVDSEAWIAVDDVTPAILEIPEVPAGRYYTAQIVDEWAARSASLLPPLDVVFKDAGAEWRGAGCSMCLGMNPDQLTPGLR